jgi:N-methylhydantoinase B
MLTGARLAILNNRMEGVARKMANTLLRTGRSGVLNRARDFSCCIVTRDCDLLTAADSLPIHVLSGPDLMARAMHDFHPVIRRGDAYLNNSPYHGCSHAADHTLLVPVIDEEGVHRFTVVAKAHQADIGNSIPTTYHGAARDVYEEGALIFPAVKVQSDYETLPDFIRMCEMRIRVPEQWRGDFLAMVGAARIGEREILSLGAEFGWDVLEGFAAQWLDYSEGRMDHAIRALPAGTGRGASTHDSIPGLPPEGVTISATVTVDPAAGYVDVDLRDNPDCLPCGLNLSESCARTAAMIGVFNSVDARVPKNSGSFRRLRIHLRENCIAGVPLHPTSCSVATTNIADRVGAAVHLALAQISDTIGLAEAGPVLPPSLAVVSGLDPRSGELFVNQLFLGHTGGPASAGGDAWMTYCHFGNGGLCFIDSVEMDELYQPILVRERSLVIDSEGAGRFRGAPSLRVDYGPADSSIDIAYGADGVVNAPQGVRGGLAGGAGSQHRVSAGGFHPGRAAGGRAHRRRHVRRRRLRPAHRSRPSRRRRGCRRGLGQPRTGEDTVRRCPGCSRRRRCRGHRRPAWSLGRCRTSSSPPAAPASAGPLRRPSPRPVIASSSVMSRRRPAPI